MLVLTRVKEEAIMIGNDIEIKVLDVRGDRVRIGIVAPTEIAVHRKEVFLAIQKENREASKSGAEGIDNALQFFRKEGREGKKEKGDGEDGCLRDNP